MNSPIFRQFKVLQWALCCVPPVSVSLEGPPQMWGAFTSAVDQRLRHATRGGSLEESNWMMVPPSDVCWFINPIDYSYIYHKP